METISKEQFKQRYGSDALNNFKQINADRGVQDKSQPIKNFGIGVAKGLGESVFETGNLITEGGRYLQAGLLPGKTVKDLQAEAKLAGDTQPAWVNPFSGKNEENIRGALKADGTAQKAGKVSAFVGEMVSPFAINKAAALTKSIPQLSKLRNTMHFAAKTSEEVVPENRALRLINKYRVQLSDIDPRYETVLQNQKNADKVMHYFDVAEEAAVNPKAPMATSIASRRAVDAYEAIGRGMDEAGAMKRELLDSVGDVKMPGNIPGRSIDNVKAVIQDRFGVVIDAKGNVSQAPGRIASIDDKSQKLISEYVTSLRQLGPNPSARKLDDFVDRTQRMLYKQSSPNLLEVADEPVTAFLKQETGHINGQLKATVDGILKAQGKDPSYGALNQKYHDLIEIQNNLNKRLGTEGDKGASLMKSLFSPQTGEPTRRLFQQVLDETGIDLFEEATLAKFVMESVGDPRSKTLLQTIDSLSGDVSKLSITEPGTWLNAVREMADLDGRRLAEEIVKQNADEAASATKALDTEADQLVKGITKRLDGSSSNSVPEYLQNNQQAGFFKFGSNKGSSKKVALEEGIADIEVKMADFDDRGVSPDSAAYKKLTAAREALYKKLANVQ